MRKAKAARGNGSSNSQESAIGGCRPERFFPSYISGSDEIPYSDFPARAGWTIRDTSQRRATLGFSVNRDSGASLTITSVDRESGASEAGLKEGDVCSRRTAKHSRAPRTAGSATTSPTNALP